MPEINSPQKSLPAFESLLTSEMAQVDVVIHQRLASDVALVNQVSQYIVYAGGKRLRPKVLLLVANALAVSPQHRHEMAAVIEFIHTATLLHDDVVDESTLRRGRQTSNALFGNAASVLVGDFLYSRAFQMMLITQRLRVLDVLAEATNMIAEGEVLQLMNMHNPDIAIADYMRVIDYKTAKLFEASARLGAVICDAPAEVEQACADYGRALGAAFQLVDDALDYEGSSQLLGKNIGDDLREGKPTLPLLIAMQRCNATERDMIHQAILQGEVQHLPEIVKVVTDTGAIQATREAAKAQTELAQGFLVNLPGGAYTNALMELAALSVNRFN